MADRLSDVERAKEWLRKLGTMYAEQAERSLARLLAEVRAEAMEKCCQIALEYRDEADAGKHPDARDPEHSLGQGFAANVIAKRIRSQGEADR